MNDFEKENLKKYYIPGQNNFCKRKVNQINLNGNCSLLHHMGIIEECVKLLKENKSFITEAVPNDKSRSDRRIDIVNLSIAYPDGEIEVETSKSVKKEGARTIYV